jgi:hypothetical protein
MPMKPASSSDNASGNPLARLLASAALKGQRPMMHKAIEVLQVLFSISIDGMFSVISVPHLQG